jgi:uroporphyrinogen-III synthase
MADKPLAGARILVTRPKGQAKRLADAISAQGGEPVEFPVIKAIGRDPGEIAHATGQLFEPDVAIFISGNAVRFGLASAGSGKIAAIGPATAGIIEQYGRTVDIQVPTGFTSEDLLTAPELQDLHGKVIRIIRGNGGRELLAQTLHERGATVEYLEVYSRQVPAYSSEGLAAIEQQLSGGDIDFITVMSVESLLNLVKLLPSTCVKAFANAPLVTPATRVIKEADDRFPGITTILAAGPQADAMVEAIVAHLNTGHPDD